MREIKFRAWDSEKEVMAEVVRLDEEDVTMTDGALTYWDSVRDYIAVVMQYTGLKDKNGTEIYEGDVLDVQEDTVQIVCWDEHQARYKSVPLYLYHINAGAGGWTGHNLHNRKLEVIGNIHQHPELLNN